MTARVDKRIFPYLTRQAIKNQETFQGLLALGVNPDDWPAGRAKSLFQKFLEGVKEHGFEHAQWLHGGSLAFEEIMLECEGYSLDGDEAVVREEYFRVLKSCRVSMLIDALSSNPEDADHTIKKWQEHKAQGVEVKSFEEGFDAFDLDRLALINAGEACVTIDNWPILSEMIGGFNPGRTGVLIADTGFGKTNIASQIAIDASKYLPTLYINMEMNQHDFLKRLTASVSQKTFKEIDTATCDLSRAREEARRRKLFFTTGKDLSLYQIQGVARRYRREQNIKLMVVDYDQKLALDRRDEEWRELQHASVALESLAKELDIYILLLAQSNHDGGISGSRRSLFSASTVLYFGQEDDGEARVYLRTLKNRFGHRNSMLVVDYKPEMSVVREKMRQIWVGKKKREYKP